MVESLEEVVCLTCKVGKVRPLQFSFNQAIINCDNSECDSYLEKWPWECIVSNALRECPTSYEKESLSSSDSSGIQSDFCSSASSDYSSADKEIELLFKEAPKDFNPVKSSTYANVPSSVNSSSCGHVKLEKPQIDFNVLKSENIHEEFFGLLNNDDIFSKNLFVKSDRETFDITKMMENNLVAQNLSANNGNAFNDHSACSPPTTQAKKHCNPSILSDFLPETVSCTIDSFQTSWENEFMEVKESSDDYKCFSSFNIKEEESSGKKENFLHSFFTDGQCLGSSVVNDRKTFKMFQEEHSSQIDHQAILYPSANSENCFNGNSNIDYTNYSALLSPEKRPLEALPDDGLMNNLSSSQNLDNNCDTVLKSSEIDDNCVISQFSNLSSNPHEGDYDTKDFCDSKLVKTEVASSNIFNTVKEMEDSSNSANHLNEKLISTDLRIENELENMHLGNNKQHLTFENNYQNVSFAFMNSNSSLPSSSVDPKSNINNCKISSGRSNSRKKNADRVQVETSVENVTVKVEFNNETDETYGTIHRKNGAAKHFTNKSVDKLSSPEDDEIPIITIDEDDNLDIIIPAKKSKQKQISPSPKASAFFKESSDNLNSSPQFHSPLFDCFNDSLSSESVDSPAYFNIYIPSYKFGNLKAEPEYFNSSLEIENTLFEVDHKLTERNRYPIKNPPVKKYRRKSYVNCNSNSQVKFLLNCSKQEGKVNKKTSCNGRRSYRVVKT